MSRLPRYRAARDSNEPEIVEHLREHGIAVYLTDEPADLLCFDPEAPERGWRLLEVKDPETQATRGRRKNPEGLTPAQQRFRTLFPPASWPLVVASPEEALRRIRVESETPENRENGRTK